ncbi:MAG TPA: hypothetical protein VFT35_07345 [Gaiellaceae bacterium]|nr:hypothetical protein [Gaiellaceae bacterium]
MRYLALASVLVTALLTGATVAAAADVGANDDSAKFEADGGAALYGRMAALGLRQTVIGVRFVPSDALTVQDKPLLDRAIASATEAGLKVVLAVYPYPPREIEAGMGSPSLFASYVGVLASIYPQIRQFVIGNEPNQPAFWRPQFDAAGANVSASRFGPYLAAAYDTLKGVDPTISVIGVGLSPRGNDRPTARNNISTSPVRFLRSLGAWYRRSGRTRPLMDGFSFHPYPNEATDPLERGYQWPNAGFANLDRIKQALWDAFDGTAQPTTLDGLALHLDEVGWQVNTRGRVGYQGLENVPVTDEATQATIYGKLVRDAACDSDVASVSFFGFRDDGLRTGFQAGLERADGTARPSAAAVMTAIPAGCGSAARVWAPGAEVIGANVAVGEAGPEVIARVAAGEDARARVCLRTLTSTLTRCRAVSLVGRRPLDVAVRAPAGTTGWVEVAVEFSADSNRARRTRVLGLGVVQP